VEDFTLTQGGLIFVPIYLLFLLKLYASLSLLLHYQHGELQITGKKAVVHAGYS
jgi:hypothetical protein